ncbi:hypothetical protein [Ferruginibacter sp. HRS2-29]|nr:hypothetical protein [Ferruginibacter sp. HRS2-29]
MRLLQRMGGSNMLLHECDDYNGKLLYGISALTGIHGVYRMGDLEKVSVN